MSGVFSQERRGVAPKRKSADGDNGGDGGKDDCGEHASAQSGENQALYGSVQSHKMWRSLHIASALSWPPVLAGQISENPTP
jgi:hypothetical protein